MRRVLFTSLLMTMAMMVYAEPVRLVVTETVLEVLPQYQAKIKRLLDRTDLSYEIEALPGDRALHLVADGLVAADLFRTRGLISNFDQLIEVPSPVHVQAFALIVPEEDKAICIGSVHILKSLRVIGIARAKINETVIFPMYYEGFEVATPDHALKMLKGERADTILWPDSPVLRAALPDWVTVCENSHVAPTTIHIAVHESYDWLVPILDSALQSDNAP